MDLAEAQRIIDQKKDDIRRLEARIESIRVELKHDEQAFAHIVSLIRNSEIRAAGISFPSGGRVERAIREAISKVHLYEPIFTSRSILDYFATLPESELGFDLEANRANVSSYLSDFSAQGLIETVERGSGRRATTYRMVNTEMPVDI